MKSYDLGAYGKLSLSKEFLRHGCYDGLPLQFKQWLDAGNDFASARDALPGHDERTRRWTFTSPGGAQVIVACVVDSHDASGTRRFPFAVFVTLARADLGLHGSTTRLEPLWGALETRLAELRRCPSPDSFYEQIRGSVLQGEPDSDSAVEARAREFRTSPAATWVDRLYAQDAPDLWVRGLWRLRSWVRHFANAAPGPVLRAARVPVTGDATSCAREVDLWIEVLRKLHPSFSALPTVWCAPMAGRATTVDLVYRVPGAEDFAASLGGEFPDGSVCDLVRGKGKLPIDGFGDFRRRIESGPFQPGASVGAVLEFEIDR
ncbi:MAG: TagF domain-containing protein [Planctomycetota bacterium]